jgi:hypothetical protein
MCHSKSKPIGLAQVHSIAHGFAVEQPRLDLCACNDALVAGML